MTDAFDLLIARASVVGGKCVHDDRTCPERTALRALSTHRFDHAGDHDLQTAARAAGRDIDVYASVAVSRGDDPFPVQNRPTREFFYFLDSIQDTTSDILKRCLDSGRSFATMCLPILVTQLLNEDCLSSRAATVSSEDDTQVLRIHAGMFARS